MIEPTTSSEYEEFSPLEYLQEYYLSIGAENDFLLRMAAVAYKDFAPDSLTVLEVGGGPTIYQLASSAPVASEIHFTDYSQNNLDEVKNWLEAKTGSFDWDQFVKRGLEHESAPADSDAIKQRTQAIRSKVVKLSRYDVINDALLDTGVQEYDLVSAVFCTDAITDSVEGWKVILKNIHGKIKDNGWLILVGVLGSNEWVMGDAKFKATNLNRETVSTALDELGFSTEIFEITSAEEGADHGYEGVFYIKTKKIR